MTPDTSSKPRISRERRGFYSVWKVVDGDIVARGTTIPGAWRDLTVRRCWREADERKKRRLAEEQQRQLEFKESMRAAALREAELWRKPRPCNRCGKPVPFNGAWNWRAVYCDDACMFGKPSEDE